METTVRVGVSMTEMPDMSECARHLDSWTPPLPVGCNRIGVFAQSFAILAYHARLNYTLVPLGGKAFGRTIGPLNGSDVDGAMAFDGYLGMLQRGEVDIISSAVNWRDYRARHFAYLRPMRREKVQVLVSVAKQERLLQSATMLTDEMGYDLWLAFVIAFLLLRHLGQLAASLLGRDYRLVIVCQILLAIHFINIYKGTLLSALLVVKTESSVTTLGDMVDGIERGELRLILPRRHGLTVEVVNDTQTEEFERLRAALKIYPAIVFTDNATLSVELLNRKEAVYLSIAGFLDFYHLLAQNCDLLVVAVEDEAAYNSYQSMVVRQELTSLANQLNEVMDEVSFSLVVPTMEAAYMHEIENVQHKCMTIKHESRRGFAPVSLTSLTGPVFLLGLVAILACLVALGEVVVKWC